MISKFSQANRHINTRMQRAWRFGAIAFSTLAAIVTVTAAQANPIAYNLYIENGSQTPLSNNGPNCAATALVNSFTYLNNAYHNTYGGTQLTRGAAGNTTLNDARNELCGIIGNATNQNIWQGKLQWFGLYAPNRTMFEGMTVDNTAGWTGSQFLTGGSAPTVAFLQQQINSGEDVELGIDGANGFGHEITLTGIQLLNGAITLNYIDPNCVQGTNGNNPNASQVTATQQANGLHFNWQNGNGLVCGGAAIDVRIDSAWAESPIPEPASLILLGCFGGALVLLRRRLPHPPGRTETLVTHVAHMRD